MTTLHFSASSPTTYPVAARNMLTTRSCVSHHVATCLDTSAHSVLTSRTAARLCTATARSCVSQHLATHHGMSTHSVLTTLAKTRLFASTTPVVLPYHNPTIPRGPRQCTVTSHVTTRDDTLIARAEPSQLRATNQPASVLAPLVVPIDYPPQPVALPARRLPNGILCNPRRCDHAAHSTRGSA